MLKKLNIYLKSLLTVMFFVAAGICIITYPTMLLWNWLMPKIFGLTILSFWETFGILFLSTILFKSQNSYSHGK